MKTHDEEVTWDDMMFENRNKEYGAYVLRSTYSENMIAGELVAMGFIVLVCISPAIATLFGWRVNADSIKKELIQVVLNAEPRIERPETKKVEQQKPQQTNSKVVPLVTDNTTKDDSTAMVQDPPADNNDGGDGNSGGGTSTEPGEVETPEPPVVDEKTIYDFSEVKPEYEGGMQAMTKFLQRNIKYPAPDKRLGTEGTVFVSFVVDRSGSMTDVKVVRGISSTCDKEAMRVISMMPVWKPGANNKVPVSVRMVLPIKFKLDR